MKLFRTFILVLLAVLLPVRGAVAAAMACPESAAAQTAGVSSEHEHHHVHADPAKEVQGAVAHHTGNHDDSSGDAPGGEHAGTCQFCASGCCVTPLAFGPPAVAVPPLTNGVGFPEVSAPAPTFQSGGPERPPRSI